MLGARLGAERAGVSLPGLWRSILLRVGSGVGATPPRQTLQCCHFGSIKALAAEPGVDKLAMSGARGGSRSQGRSTAHGAGQPDRRAPSGCAALLRSSGLPAPSSRGLHALSAVGRFSPVIWEAPRVRVPLPSRRRRVQSSPGAPGGTAQ